MKTETGIPESINWYTPVVWVYSMFIAYSIAAADSVTSVTENSACTTSPSTNISR